MAFCMVLTSCSEQDEVTINENPTVNILELDENLVYPNNGTIMLMAEAHSPKSEISKVEFWINDSIVQTVFEAPYQYTWYDREELRILGTYHIKAIAYDENDSTGLDEVPIEVIDFREKYYGEYRFTQISYIHNGTSRDTTDTSIVNDGWIRAFDVSDEPLDHSNWTGLPSQRRMKMKITPNDTIAPGFYNEQDEDIYYDGSGIGTITALDVDTIEIDFVTNPRGGAHHHVYTIGIRK